MENEASKKSHKLTFSQREGKVLPEPMQIGKISKKFRQLVWCYIDQRIRRVRDERQNSLLAYCAKIRGESLFYSDSSICNVLFSCRLTVLDQNKITSSTSASEDAILVKNIILQEYHKVLTFIEHILRHEECPQNLRENLIDAFDEAPIAYVDAINGLPTIVPRTSMEAGEATKKALETIQEDGMDGAAAHLRQAVEHINAQQYANSIADSILAVEFVACKIVRKIDPKAKAKTLGEALKLLQKDKDGVLKHERLKVVLDKLYSYANNVPGSRHALPDKGTDKDSPDVGLDEAMFMFGACASFAAYLVSKHHELEKQKK